MHQCSICMKTFPSASKLQRHHLIHTGQKPFHCTVCGKAFNQFEHLKTHTQKIHHFSPSTDSLKDSIFINDLHFIPSNHTEATPEIYRHGDGDTDNITFLSTKSSIVSSQTEKKAEILPQDICLPSFEMEGQPEAIPRVNDDLMIQNYISTDGSLFTDQRPHDKVGFAAMDESVCYAKHGYTCKICLKSFSSYLQLQIHLPVHEKMKQFESAMSGKTFKSSPLKMHSLSHELSSYGGKITYNHQCPTCLKTFCSPSKLRRHFLVHTGQKPFSCMLCGKAFRQETHLKSHLRTAHKHSLSQGDLEPNQVHSRTKGRIQRSYNGILTSDLESQSSVLQHPFCRDTPANSSVELELQCKISVSAPQDLDKPEIKSETTIKPEQSVNDSGQHRKSICSQTLNEPVGHEQYNLSHKDLKPFQCTICNRSFHLEVSLIRHQDIHKNQNELQSHLVADTRNTVLQSVNTKTQINSTAMTSPEPKPDHPIDLNVIVKSETWSNDNNSLLQVNAPDQQTAKHKSSGQRQKVKTTVHQCHACSKSFPSLSKLLRHTMTHTGQRPFECKICGKRFRQKTHLRVHSRTHLWSKYHRQRSMYISRPPSRRLYEYNTRLPADVTIQEPFAESNSFAKDSGSQRLLEKQLGRFTSARGSAGNDNSTEPAFLPSAAIKNEFAHLSTVSQVTVKRKQTFKPAQNTSGKQHKCLLCFKCFPSASKLQRHEMVHTGLKPFRCPVCGKTFRQAAHLKAHERTHSKWRTPNQLHQQGKTCKTKATGQQQLYPRINIHVPPQRTSIKIETVHSKFANISSDQENSEQLPGQSETSIPQVKNLKTGIKIKASCGKRKGHACRICLKSFATPSKLSRHLLTHFGIRPYKCSVCSETFTQFSNLKAHEHSRRHHNRATDYIQGEMTRSDNLQDRYVNNGHAPETMSLPEFIDSREEAATEQTQQCYASAGHYLVTGFSHSSEATRSDWLAVPEVGLLEENMEPDSKQRGNCNKPCSQSSFPSELASEIQRLVQNQEVEGPSCSQQEMGGNIHSSAELGFQPSEIIDTPDSNVVFSEEPVSSLVEKPLQAGLLDNYWCKPLSMFKCDKCSGGFENEQDLQCHKCNAGIQPKVARSALKYHCDICFKNFVSPSKLERHYIIHTGQRPFGCDICGKTFTQSTHLKTHHQTHKLGK